MANWLVKRMPFFHRKGFCREALPSLLEDGSLRRGIWEAEMELWLLLLDSPSWLCPQLCPPGQPIPSQEKILGTDGGDNLQTPWICSYLQQNHDECPGRALSTLPSTLPPQHGRRVPVPTASRVCSQPCPGSWHSPSPAELPAAAAGSPPAGH